MVDNLGKIGGLGRRRKTEDRGRKTQKIEWGLAMNLWPAGIWAAFGLWFGSTSTSMYQDFGVASTLISSHFVRWVLYIICGLVSS